MAVVCLGAPLEFKNSRERSTIVSPRQVIRMRGSAVTSATRTACRFSANASAKNCCSCSAAITTAIRSCDSEMASSVPSRPSYFFGTLSRLICRPSANSPMATLTPPAPKSLHFLIRRLTSGRRNRR